MEEHMIDFPKLLDKFAAAVVANDGAGLGALFAPDGVYADEFFGAHQGRAAIAAMLRRFHDTGGVEYFGFTPRELSIACASHEGSALHVQTVEGIQKKIGVDESSLQ